ncbi:histidine phosphatase family protein [Thermus scotoductus]|uniref:Alpha-ribazole phosphatase n=1 Tax=Thermus scotoductus TaxID=37636 RepID=A0A430RWP9_THESC|nr:histidine phosphatase family protein [Thermus scotoductus]RTH24886.1 alpha-ribazole phosphatase [Thermus scotoductus]RTI39150.1 alpha-ribazole phosphatase [Thermus scotoductus]
MELWLVRHGETLWNQEGRLLGWTDLPLTPLGRGQARALRGLLPPLPAYSSDLRRALETAALAGFAPKPTRALREIHFGALEGASWETLDSLHKEALLRFQGFHPPGGESLEAFQERVFRFLEGLKEPAVLFTHGGVVRAVLRALGEDGLVPPGSAVVVDWPKRVLAKSLYPVRYM